MHEILVEKSGADSILNDLKSKIESLDKTNPHIQFADSKMDLINQIKQIEEEYYQILKNYIALLADSEVTARTSIDDLLETDRELARKNS